MSFDALRQKLLDELGAELTVEHSQLPGPRLLWRATLSRNGQTYGWSARNQDVLLGLVEARVAKEVLRDWAEPEKA